MGTPIGTRSLPPWKLVPLIVACSILAGCDDGPTAPSSRVVPTPIPTNVAGNWRGTRHGGGPTILCGEDIPAAATFSQDGSRVTGTITLTQNGIPGTSEFVGDVQDTRLTGTLTSGGSPTSVTGTASSTHITMRYGRENLFCQMLTIELVR